MCNEYPQVFFPQPVVYFWTEAGRSLTARTIGQIDVYVGMLIQHSSVDGYHSERVANHVETFARFINLPPLAVMALKQAARLHDIGKLLTPAHLLAEEGGLTADEYGTIKLHVPNGEAIVQTEMDLPPVFRALTIEGIHGHHRYYDGLGYPPRKMGEEISFFGRILALADTLDAVGLRGGYQPTVGIPEALRQMNDPSNMRMAGKFDHALLKPFTQAMQPQRAFLLPEETRRFAGGDASYVIA